jgi:formylglycine-generating enzyme required for sulfatase activity
VLVDFGMARIEDSQLSRSQSAVMQGTPAYMSPEQIRMGSVPVDARTDVYSLGVTLFEWLTGTQPFVSATREGLLRAIAETPLPNLRSHLPSPSRDLELVIGKATEKDPTDRYQTAGEFAEDLRRILKREPVRARGAGALLQARRFVARRPLLATALAIGVFALLLITYLWTRADRALDEYDLVARTHSISQLLVDAENLWPLDARRINDLQAWLSRVDAVAPELAVLEQRLASIRGTMVLRRAEDTPPHMRAEEAKIVGPDGGSVNLLRRDTWLATDLRKQFRHDTLEQAVEGLRAIVGKGERGGLRAEVADRLRFLETVEARSVTALDEIWKQTISDIADVSKNPAYGGLRILPQIGLIPIGKDETSNLFEFMDLYTTEKSVLDVTKIREPGQPIAASPELGTIFVLLPGGTFAMGSVNSKEAQSSPNDPIDSEAEYAETPTTMVTLDAFFLSKFELTQAQWLRFASEDPSFWPETEVLVGDDLDRIGRPIENVSWLLADQWLRRIGWTLPTEAQWEYAARGGTTTPWSTGPKRESLFGYANIAASEFRLKGSGVSRILHEAWNDGHEAPWRVGKAKPNPFGLHDMHGNVAEWCQDSLNMYTTVLPRAKDGLRESVGEKGKTIRGGSWVRDAHWARSSSRMYNRADYRRNEIGVRPARVLTR